ncbi:CAP domain-containing protein [Aquibacillus salsiterrae]|uniref:CAP domain-containing protein n=1 Tax=Aquibacillus salsiterrae TaxID=2950439 RepID=A0A9X4AF20_9BACI|nr:CAP domain-containing protein [Aquibacillus salsiterrae]MDC3417416.1 CAP domain-containing protein [Aquibacillus salsiterrae]
MVLKKIRNIIVLALIAATFWNFYGDTFNRSGATGVLEEIGSDINDFKTNPNVVGTIEQLNREFQIVFGWIKDKANDENEQTNQTNQPNPKKPALSEPRSQTFSVHNIELGTPRSEVEQEAGQPKRKTLNEYGVNWVTYHENYQNFFMAAYNEENKVVGLYTNQDLIASSTGIKLFSTRDNVRKAFGEPLKSIKKGLTLYQIQNEQEYDVFLLDNNYVTIFYDIQNETTVTAIQIIDGNLEKEKQGFFGDPSNKLREGFEYQLFDLTNAIRVRNGLSPLTWSEPARKTARNHSIDMAENNYFGHTNPQGQSPFNRMDEDNISFWTAGENLAMGQSSSIFANEGLMNSPGHRKIILKEDFEMLSVGVAFNKEDQPYYTETFYAE